MSARFVERRQRAGKFILRVGENRVGARLRRLLGRERRGFCCGEAAREVLLHQPHTLEILERVQAQAALRSGGAEELIAPLPRP